MELNKSDRNYLILVLIVIISVFSLKIKPINFRLFLKGLVLVFLFYFLFKRDVKVSLFLTLLLFSLNQNGIGNSIDFFENHNRPNSNSPPDPNEIEFPEEDLNDCYKKCYGDSDIDVDSCEDICNNKCVIHCSSELENGSKFSECKDICDLHEGFANNNNKLESNEGGCRIKCLEENIPHSECKETCKSKCVNTCTSSERTFDSCSEMCS